MTKISFSKKHMIISVLLGIAIIGMAMLFWGILIQPKAAKVGELKKQIVSLSGEIQNEQIKVDELINLPALLETTMVTETPKIPNGMSLADYFQGLAQKNTVSLQHITFEDKPFFPEVVEGSPEISDNQIRSLVMSFDVIGDTEPNLLSFIEKLENDDRFIKVTQVTYRHNPDSIGEGSFAYSATISLNMYYLSHFETGQPLSDGSQGEK